MALRLIPEEPSLPEPLDKRQLLELLRYLKLPPDIPSRQYLLKIYLSYRMLMPVAPRGLEFVAAQGYEGALLDLLPVDPKFPYGAGMPPRACNWLLARMLASLGFNTDLLPVRPGPLSGLGEPYAVLIVEDDLGPAIVDAGIPLPFLPVPYNSREPSMSFTGFELRLELEGMHSFTARLDGAELFTTEPSSVSSGEYYSWKQKLGDALGREAEELPEISWLKDRRYSRLYRDRLEWREHGRVKSSKFEGGEERLQAARLGIPVTPDDEWLEWLLG